jgi:hypothetical protein
MTDDKATARLRPGIGVLIVHEASADVTRMVTALRTYFIVREATSPLDTLERLASGTFACVLAVMGPTIRGEDFHTFVTRTAPETARRMVFVGDDPSESDRAFFQRSGSHCLPTSVNDDELLAVVRAVSTPAK